MAEYVDSAACANIRRIDQAFLLRTFYVFIVLAIASALIAAAGRWLGPSISMGGYTDDPALREIVIGNNVLSVPANAIRFPDARHDGVAARLPNNPGTQKLTPPSSAKATAGAQASAAEAIAASALIGLIVILLHNEQRPPMNRAPRGAKAT